MFKIILLSLLTVSLFLGSPLNNSAPLVFKTTKVLNAVDFGDLAVVDLNNYARIRISIKVEKPESESQRVNIYSFEDGKEVFIFGQSGENLTFSTIIELPPSKLKFKGRGNGTYNIQIWATN